MVKRRLKAGQKANPVDVPEAVTKRIEAEDQRGRPTMFTPELGQKICDLHAAGATMNRISKMDGMPTRMTFWRWRNGKNKAIPAQFAIDFAEAHETFLQGLEEEILDIADDGSNDTYVRKNGTEAVNMDVVARSRLRVDARVMILRACKAEQWRGSALSKQAGEQAATDNPLADMSDSALLEELRRRTQERPNGNGADEGRAPRGNGKAMH